MNNLETRMPRISCGWRLRNDGNNLIAYKCTTDKNTYKIFSPFEASLVPLIDGTNSFLDLKNLCMNIYGNGIINRSLLELKFENMFHNLMTKFDDLISLEGEASPSFSMDKRLLLVDFNKYKFPINRLERPIAVSICYTERCAFNCIYCYAERSDCKEVSIQTWNKFLDTLLENEIFIVDIGGSDIFLRSDAYEILQELSSRNFAFFVSTKSYLSEKDAERLYAMGIGRVDVPEYLRRTVQISVDSADNEKASWLVGYPNHFNNAFNTVKNLMKQGIKPRVKGVLTSFNADAPEGLINRFMDIGVTDFQFVQYSRGLYRHEDKMFLTRDQKLRLLEISESLKAKHPSLNVTIQEDITVGGRRNVSPEKWNERPVCSGGRSKLIVKSNGDVTLCEQVPMNDQFVVGNVFKEELLKIWNSNKLLSFVYPPKGNFIGSVCHECTSFNDCHDFKGYCFRDSYACYDSIYEAPPDCPFQDKMPVRAI